MVFSLALLTLIVIFVLYLVIPQVIDCFVIISKDVPEVFQNVIQFLIEKSDELPSKYSKHMRTHTLKSKDMQQIKACRPCVSESIVSS